MGHESSNAKKTLKLISKVFLVLIVTRPCYYASYYLTSKLLEKPATSSKENKRELLHALANKSTVYLKKMVPGLYLNEQETTELNTCLEDKFKTAFDETSCDLSGDLDKEDINCVVTELKSPKQQKEFLSCLQKSLPKTFVFFTGSIRDEAYKEIRAENPEISQEKALRLASCFAEKTVSTLNSKFLDPFNRTTSNPEELVSDIQSHITQEEKDKAMTYCVYSTGLVKSE